MITHFREISFIVRKFVKRSSIKFSIHCIIDPMKRPLNKKGETSNERELVDTNQFKAQVKSSEGCIHRWLSS